MVSTNARIRKLEEEIAKLRQEERQLQADAVAFYKWGGALARTDVDLTELTVTDWMEVRELVLAGKYTTRHIAGRQYSNEEEAEKARILLRDYGRDKKEKDITALAIDAKEVQGSERLFEPAPAQAATYMDLDTGERKSAINPDDPMSSWTAQQKMWDEGLYQAQITDYQRRLEFKDGFTLEDDGSITRTEPLEH